jgi:DNA-binding response OmpR family regulator
MATILVVDDEQLICDLMRSVFSAHGHEVLMASNGREGLELFKKHRPRFTLLDLWMPEMDGVQVLQQIRAIDPQAPVIMLTGRGTDSLEIQARGLGVTDFLRKTIPLETLVKMVDRGMQRSGKAAQAPPTAVAMEDSSSNGSDAVSVLVVDDEPQIRDMLRKFLSARNYQVRVAADGQQALALVDQKSPDIIVLDVKMPGMNGIEVLKRLRAKNYAGGVIVLTSSRDETLLQEGLELGSVDVLGKPVDLERLELTIQVGCILSTP